MSKALVAMSSLALAASCAFAGPVTYTGSTVNPASGNTLAASARFEVVGTNLLVTLHNIAATGVSRQTDILTGVFFDVAGNPGKLGETRSANLTSSLLGTATVQNVQITGTPSQPAGGNVGGEWAFAHNPAGLSGAFPQRYGISSSGLGIFGDANFGGPNLAGPTAVNGVQYGIISDHDPVNPQGFTGANGNPHIRAWVVFSLSIPAHILDSFNPESAISNVRFHYGTSTSDPSITTTTTTTTVIPLPTGAGLAMAGLGVLAFRRRR